jgi:hypothetical protein
LGVAFVIGQGLVVWGFLRFVKSFGAYAESHQAFTKALLGVHEQNLLVLGELQAMRKSFQGREVA